MPKSHYCLRLIITAQLWVDPTIGFTKGDRYTTNRKTVLKIVFDEIFIEGACSTTPWNYVAINMLDYETGKMMKPEKLFRVLGHEFAHAFGAKVFNFLQNILIF
jgi:hypothetical protein